MNGDTERGAAPRRRRAALAAPAAVALAAAATCALPLPAYADFLSDVDTIFDNVGDIGTTIYYGIVSIITIVCFITFGKELLPALLDSRKRDSPDFKTHVMNAIIAAVVLVAFFLLPTLVPALLDFFGAASGGSSGYDAGFLS